MTSKYLFDWRNVYYSDEPGLNEALIKTLIKHLQEVFAHDGHVTLKRAYNAFKIPVMITEDLCIMDDEGILQISYSRVDDTNDFILAFKCR